MRIKTIFQNMYVFRSKNDLEIWSWPFQIDHNLKKYKVNRCEVLKSDCVESFRPSSDDQRMVMSGHESGSCRNTSFELSFESKFCYIILSIKFTIEADIMPLMFTLVCLKISFNLNSGFIVNFR